MSWHMERPGWVMRVLISLAAFIVVFAVGAKTEWMTVSSASAVTREDGALQAVVLGETRSDATSGELIDAAVTRGDISSEQGLLYGVYLACGDPQLPAQFRGQDATPPEKNILWEADVDWAFLSPDIQRALQAFFVGGPNARPGLECAAEVARLKSDQTVWWAPALKTDAPVKLATN